MAATGAWGAVALLGCVHAAWAQETDTGTIETVTVTANQRVEDMEKVPIAISAFNADTLNKAGVTGTTGLTELVPGLAYDRSSVGTTPYLRGIGNSGSGVGVEPGVATYVDDVYMPNTSAAVFDYNSIESVEVLKGPQGTLFGRNAAGGVIVVHTKDPSLDTAVNADIGYGNFSTYTGHFYATTGITNNLAVNIAVSGHDQVNGWGRDYVTGLPTFSDTGFGLSAKALWTPTDRTTVLASFSLSGDRGEQGLAARSAPNVYGTNDFKAETTYPGIGFWDGTEGLVNQHATWLAETGSVKVSQEFDDVSAVSITSFTHARSTQNLDLDAGPALGLQTNPVTQPEDDITQEFRLLSHDDARLKWNLGAFYMHDQSSISGAYQGSANGTLAGKQLTDSYALYGQASEEILTNTTLTLGLRYTIDDRSFWATETYAPTNKKGGPWADGKSWDGLTGRASLAYQFTPDIMGYVAYNRGFKSGLFNVASISPTPSPPASTPFPAKYAPVNPEKVSAYTIGMKSTLFDDTVRFNVEGFYYDFTNIQVVVVNPTGGTSLINGSAASMRGVDADLTYQVTEHLSVSAAAEIENGSYGDFPGGPVILPWGPNTPIAIPAGCGSIAYPVRPTTGAAASTPATQISCNLRGNKTVQTPPFSLSLVADYRIPSSVGPFDFNFSYAHGGNFYFSADNLPDTKQPPTNIVNLSLTWTQPNGHYDVKLWVNNLTEDKYFSFASDSTSAYAKYAPAAPRTFGITLGAAL
ncbi:MAG: TonB-dependent receptor [Rhizomicrobium sp.]